ncbi:MAG TPA: exodeoxyribonuclease VII large subunit [Calditrichaeota bacterium]|nr:exodeoxyribonuclease VII large subunit [Calditrichota bacterium]
MSTQKVYSISEITRIVKLLIEENIPTIWLEGEISNFKAHYSGHYYFTLKDENAQISAVIWKSRTVQLTFAPEDGMLVRVLGNIRLYEKSGRYQLDIIRIMPSGIGQLQQKFEELKAKLLAEGLFDEKHKKALPPFPRRIGIVTSETGAAIRDMINVLRRRAPQIQIILRPAKVQGEGAAKDIAAAIREFNEYGDVDVIIVGRGGGSLEDLWAFNEEEVIRAIFDSDIPIVSAVGHEIDFTIADFVADLRAPTPSAAAELVWPKASDVRATIIDFRQRIYRAVYQKIEYYHERLNNIRRSYGFRQPEDRIKQFYMQLDDLNARLIRAFQNTIGRQADYVKQLHLRLQNLNPKKVLERGYSISYVKGKIVREAGKLRSGMQLLTELHKGTLLSEIKKVQSK